MKPFFDVLSFALFKFYLLRALVNHSFRVNMTEGDREELHKGEVEDHVTIPIEKREAEVQPFLVSGEPCEAPKDKYSLVYLIIFLHGIGTLMPWNMFITIANTYYVGYKMKEEKNGTYTDTWYSEQYMSAQNICSQLPNLLLNLINIFIVVKGDLTKRIGVSLTIVGFCVLLTMSFIPMDTWSWMGGFFYLTLFIVIVLNAANGIYQNSIFGLVSDFPFKYTNAVIIGNNFCGTFVSIISIVSIYIFRGSVATQAMVYFSLSLATIIACFLSFFALKKLPYYRHYAEANKKKAEAENAENTEKGVSIGEFVDTFKEGWIGFINVFLIFFVTLTIFPLTMLNVEPLEDSPVKQWLGDDLYHSVMTFLHFNLLAFIGSMLASWKQVIPPEKMRIYVYIRLLLIPAFLFLNYRPKTRGALPVLTSSTLVFFILGAIMSLSAGYLSSLSMMYAPRYVSPSRVRIAMMMAAFFLIAGIVGGIIGSKILVEIVDLLG